MKLTDDIYSKLKKHYNGDLNEVENFLTDLKLSYSSKDQTLEGPLDALKEAKLKVIEKLDLALLNKGEHNKEESRSKDGGKKDHVEIHGYVDHQDDKARAPKKELMSGNDRHDEGIRMDVDHKDDENAASNEEVMNTNGEMVIGDEDDAENGDDGDVHSDEDCRNDKIKVPPKKVVGEKENKDGDDDDDDEILKNANRDAKEDGNMLQSDTQSQTIDQKTSQLLDLASTQSGSSENFPNDSNESEGLKQFQSNHEIKLKTYKSQASDKLSSMEHLLSQTPYSSSIDPLFSINATGSHQQYSQINKLLGIKNQSKADNVSSKHVQNETDSSTDSSDFGKIEEFDISKTRSTATGDNFSEESASKISAENAHPTSNFSNSKEISQMKLFLKSDGKANPTPNRDEMLEKINRHQENRSGKSGSSKDAATDSVLAGVHHGHERRFRNNPVSGRFNCSSGSSSGNNKIIVSDFCDDSDETSGRGSASTSERRVDQPYKSIDGAFNRSSYGQGSSSEVMRHRSHSESKSKIEPNSQPDASEMFTISNLDCDLDLLKDIIKSENNFGHIKIELNQANRDVICKISGGNDEEMRKTKNWLSAFIDANIRGADASSRTEILFIQNQNSAFEEALRLQENVLCFAVKCVEGCFIALRCFVSKLEGSYSRLHFNYGTKEMMIIFSDIKSKLDAEKKKLIYENDIKMSAHPFTNAVTQNIALKVSNRMSDVFVECNDDQKYFIIGDNEKFVQECISTASGKKKFFVFPHKNMDPPKFVQLNVEIVKKGLSEVNACRFVVFGDCGEDISLINFGFKGWARKSSIEKLSQYVELVKVNDSKKKVYLVRTPTHSMHLSKEEMLRDLYSNALYHASDGVESLAMTLTKIG